LSQFLFKNFFLDFFLIPKYIIGMSRDTERLFLNRVLCSKYIVIFSAIIPESLFKRLGLLNPLLRFFRIMRSVKNINIIFAVISIFFLKRLLVGQSGLRFRQILSVFLFIAEYMVLLFFVNILLLLGKLFKTIIVILGILVLILSDRVIEGVIRVLHACGIHILLMFGLVRFTFTFKNLKVLMLVLGVAWVVHIIKYPGFCGGLGLLGKGFLFLL